ncbi:uncharacterized [Tachysurus ichikawai]
MTRKTSPSFSFSPPSNDPRLQERLNRRSESRGAIETADAQIFVWAFFALVYGGLGDWGRVIRGSVLNSGAARDERWSESASGDAGDGSERTNTSVRTKRDSLVRWGSVSEAALCLRPEP